MIHVCSLAALAQTVKTSGASHVLTVMANVDQVRRPHSILEANHFVRIHRSVIVNLARVRELHRDSDGGGTLVLQDGVRLRIARGRWDALRGALAMQEF